MGEDPQNLKTRECAPPAPPQYNDPMRDLTNASKGQLGEKVVRAYLEEGYTVRTSSKNGTDLVARKKGKTPFRVGVKTSGNLKGGIPDMHTSEFRRRNGKWYLVADYLYVVRLDGSGRPIQIDILSKAEVDSYNGSHRLVTRIRTTKLDRDLCNKTIGKSVQLPKSRRSLERNS